MAFGPRSLFSRSRIGPLVISVRRVQSGRADSAHLDGRRRQYSHASYSLCLRSCPAWNSLCGKRLCLISSNSYRYRWIPPVYRQASEPGRIRDFLRGRFEHNQSVIFLATTRSGAIGFTKLYPSFSTGALSRIFILNDLFVDPSARHRGVGTALLQTAAEYARLVGAIRLALWTEATNTPAQALYEKLGWRRNMDFYGYGFEL